MTEHNLNNDGVNESGRTMMEMLGTLAIIGILSIGGVSGYGRAVNAYRANTIVDTAQKKAIMTSHELTTGSTVTPDINGAMKTPSGYQVTESTPTGTTGDITPDTKYFGVEVGDTTNGGKAVPVEVAKNLLDKALDSWKYVYGFGVKSADGTGNVSWVTKSGSGTGGINDAIGNNQTVIIILVYAADLSLRPGELLDGAQFVDGGSCTAGIVKIRGCDGSLTDCCPDTETCEQPINCECTTDNDCYGQQVCNDGVCGCPISYYGENPHLGKDGTTCCSEYFFAFDQGFYGTDAGDVCGCPSGSYLGTNGKTCCKNEMAMSFDSYGQFDSYSFACFQGQCPGPDLLGTDGKTCCISSTDLVVNYCSENCVLMPSPLCENIDGGGCPDGGTASLDGRTCCKDFHPWIPSEGYDVEVNYTICGNPTS